jgi:hypothetical protein
MVQQTATERVMAGLDEVAAQSEAEISSTLSYRRGVSQVG